MVHWRLGSNRGGGLWLHVATSFRPERCAGVKLGERADVGDGKGGGGGGVRGWDGKGGVKL